jgi:hypothetical protein
MSRVAIVPFSVQTSFLAVKAVRSRSDRWRPILAVGGVLYNVRGVGI